MSRGVDIVKLVLLCLFMNVSALMWVFYFVWTLETMHPQTYLWEIKEATCCLVLQARRQILFWSHLVLQAHLSPDHIHINKTTLQAGLRQDSGTKTKSKCPTPHHVDRWGQRETSCLIYLPLRPPVVFLSSLSHLTSRSWHFPTRAR